MYLHTGWADCTYPSIHRPFTIPSRPSPVQLRQAPQYVPPGPGLLSTQYSPIHPQVLILHPTERQSTPRPTTGLNVPNRFQVVVALGCPRSSTPSKNHKVSLFRRYRLTPLPYMIPIHDFHVNGESKRWAGWDRIGRGSRPQPAASSRVALELWLTDSPQKSSRASPVDARGFLVSGLGTHWQPSVSVQVPPGMNCSLHTYLRPQVPSEVQATKHINIGNRAV